MLIMLTLSGVYLAGIIYYGIEIHKGRKNLKRLRSERRPDRPYNELY